MIAEVYKRLDNSSSYIWNISSHWLIDVTYKGETKVYGGAGSGEGQRISEDKITHFFFEDNNEKITLDDTKEILINYSKIKMEDDVPQDDELTWTDVRNTVGDGAWTAIIGIASIFGGYSRVYSYFYDINGSLYHASDMWVDGRYVDSYEKFLIGEKLEDHPESNVLLSNVTVPNLIDYEHTYKYNSETEKYEYVYSNIEIDENIKTIKYKYNIIDKIWKSNIDEYDIIVNMVEQELIDEKYIYMIQLTSEEVEEYINRNTNIIPDHYYIYDGTAEPGTEFFADEEVSTTTTTTKPTTTSTTSTMTSTTTKTAKPTTTSMTSTTTIISTTVTTNTSTVTSTMETIVISGTCGENAVWYFDESTGELTISGTGEMTDFDDIPDPKYVIWNAPWYELRNNIININIEPGITSIGSRAFMYCRRLVSVTIPNTVTYIGSHAFSCCDDLVSIVLPNNITSIEERTFISCGNFVSIVIPDSVISIGEFAFYDSNLQSVTIPKNVKNIGKFAFGACSITDINIPNSVISIEEGAFKYCDELESIIIRNPECEIYDSADTIGSQTVLYGYADSTAQEYAEKYNRTFVEIDDSEIVLGDINGDGMVDAIDATAVLVEYANLSTGGSGTFSESQKSAGDVNSDGMTDAVDATMILTFYAYLSTGGTESNMRVWLDM